MFFFFNDTATTEIYTLSLHDALPICSNRRLSHGTAGNRRPPREAPLKRPRWRAAPPKAGSGQWERGPKRSATRSEEHTSELQSRQYLVCRLLLEKKKHITQTDVSKTE